MLGRHKSGRIKKSLNHIVEVVFIVEMYSASMTFKLLWKNLRSFALSLSQKSKSCGKAFVSENEKSKPSSSTFVPDGGDLQILRKKKSRRAGHATLKRHAKSPDRDSREKRSTLKFVLCVLRDKIA